jgi:hypothetical protein
MAMVFANQCGDTLNRDGVLLNSVYDTRLMGMVYCLISATHQLGMACIANHCATLHQIVPHISRFNV